MSPAFAPARIIGTPSRPTAATTGVPVGATGDTRTPLPGGESGMPVMNGLYITQPNQVYDGIRFTAPVRNNLHDSNPTFRRCRFDVGYFSGIGAVNSNGKRYGNLLIEDCTYDGQGPTNGTSEGPFGGLASSSFVAAEPGAVNDTITIRRCDISRGNHGVDIYSGNVTVEWCYIHDIAFYWGNSSGGSSITHSDGLQMWGQPGTYRNIKVQNNNVDCIATPGLNTTFQIGAYTDQYFFEDIDISNNYFNGPSYNAFHGAPPLDANCTRFKIHDNRYGLAFRGTAYGGGVVLNTIKASVIWGTGNVYDVSGTTAGGLTAVAGQPV